MPDHHQAATGTAQLAARVLAVPWALSNLVAAVQGQVREREQVELRMVLDPPER